MIDTTLLNENQKEAVLSDDQYLRIIAGAGSGKHVFLQCVLYI